MLHTCVSVLCSLANMLAVCSTQGSAVGSCFVGLCSVLLTPVSVMEGRVLKRLLTSIFVAVHTVLWLSLQVNSRVAFGKPTQEAMMRTVARLRNPRSRMRSQLEERLGSGFETPLRYAVLVSTIPPACCLPNTYEPRSLKAESKRCRCTAIAGISSTR